MSGRRGAGGGGRCTAPSTTHPAGSAGTWGEGSGLTGVDSSLTLHTTHPTPHHTPHTTHPTPHTRQFTHPSHPISAGWRCIGEPWATWMGRVYRSPGCRVARVGWASKGLEDEPSPPPPPPSRLLFSKQTFTGRWESFVICTGSIVTQAQVCV